MQTIDKSRFPKVANIARWAKLTGYSRFTLDKANSRERVKERLPSF
jgi:hypothetical protein